jgi:saccharopine dehydrogenase-like NADP-dependent oxidoreductase
MVKIFIIGAGRSSTSLINYLLKTGKIKNWKVTVGDISIHLAEEKIQGFEKARAIFFDVDNLQQREDEIQNADVVISMLPASMHYKVALSCLKFNRHLLTASYVSNEMKGIEEEVKRKNLFFLMECGLDPGIDHMTAMQAIDKIKEQGGTLISFKSFTGGLIAPDSDNNPWNYKFTWNPRNVVLAGQGTAKYIRNGKYKYIPYHKLFSRVEHVTVDGLGDFEGYPNRDSLSYRDVYNIGNIPTILRGTLRRRGFCRAWDIFVQLGITDDSYKLEDSEFMTYREFVNTFLAFSPVKMVEDKLCDYLKLSKESEDFKKLEWLGIFSDKVVGIKNASPAQVLQKILEEKLNLDTSDKDMIVMQHQFEYQLNEKLMHLTSSLVSIGEDPVNTAMSKTVGLPLAIAAKLFIEGEIKQRGIVLPILKEIYEPVLAELEEYDIKCSEKVKELEPYAVDED